MDEEEELPMVSIPQHSIEPKEEEDKKEIKENLLESKEPEEPSSNPNPKQCDFVPELTDSQLIADSSTNEPEIVGEEKVDANEANMVVEEEGIAPSMDGNEEEVVGEEIFSSRVEKDFGELEDVGEEVSEGVGEEAPLTISDYPEFAAEEGLGEFGGQGSSIGAEEREVFAEASMVAEIVAPLTDAEEMEYVAEEVPSLVANEDEKSPSKEDEIAEKAPSLGAADTEVAAEKASSMGAECDFVAEEAPSMVADEAEEPPSMVADVVEEAPSIVTNESEFVAVEIPLMAEGVAEELPSLTEDKREVVTEGTPLVVAEEPSSLIAEEDHLMIREEEPSSVVGTNHLMVQEEPSSIVAKEDHSMVQEEEVSSIVAKEHLTVQEEEPSSVVATEDHLIVQEEEPTSVVAKEDHSMVQVEEPFSVVAKEDQSTVQEEKPSSVVATENHPMIQEEEPSSVGAKEDHMMVQEEEPSSLVAKEDHLMVREEEPSSLVAEEDHVMDEEEEEVGPEVAIEAELETEEEVAADAEMETDDYEVTEIRKSGGKRKRGRPAKAQPKPLAISKTVEEDVCFICFDGGEIVLCDRRGCPKAYHPACINRDEAFFRSKGRWTCGWHICSNCQKAAYHMCYTCTFSLCKGCIKDAEFFCIRGDKGFCETCRSTIMLIEKMEQGNNEMPHVDFEDKGSWEYLFKDYWLDLKGRLSLTSDELLRARNPWKGSNELYRKEGSSDELYSANDDQSSDSDSSSGHPELRSSKKRRARGRPKSSKEEVSSVVAPKVGGEGTSTSNDAEWASEDLLEFVAHMKNGDKSFISQYDVQHLLLEYIKLNNLRDPRKKSQIVCDSRLTNLFGKPRVGHFEMLKLLENHFLVKEDAQADDTQAGNVTAEENQIEADGSGGGLKKDRRRKTRRKGDEREPQTNLDDYAAIDVHNIRLVYLRRNLLEDLLEDSDKFHDMVVGSFVRIRISGSGLKQDMYRLVQVLGTQKASQPYKTGKRSTDVVLEILNLNKTEVISIDTISNQEFSEDECKRLRQSIKCGLISRMTVGEVQEKAMTLQAVRANDLLETEKMRITHLRDRASEQGRRKELRECVEKLQLLNRPEERSRRLQEIPEVHADPNMDPNYESEEDEEPEDKQQDNYTRPRDSGFSRKGREPISPGKVSSGAVDTWNGTRKNSANASESGRNMSMRGAWGKGDGGDDRTNDFSWNQGNDAQQSNSWEKPKTQALTTGSDPGAWSGLVGRSGPSSAVPSEAALQDREVSPSFSETDKIWNYKDPSGKIQGPFSMVQLRKWSTTGYFPPQLRIWRTEEKQEDSILLNDALKGKFKKEPPPIGNSSAWNQSDRKWNSNGSQTANGNVKAANGDGWGSGSSGWSAQSQVHGPRPSSFSGQPNQNSWNTSRPTGFQPNTGKGWSAPSVETPKFAEGWGVDQSGKNTSSNLPSPTPKTGGAGWPSKAAQDGRRDFVDPPTPTPRPNNTGDWTGSQVGVPSGTVSPNTVNPHVSAWVAPGNISVERLPSPTPTAMPQAGSHSTAAFAVPNPVPSGNYAGPPNMMSNQNIQPPVPVNANWGMTPNQNPNPAWGPPPPPPPDNQVAGWSAPPPNTNVGWGGPEQGHAATGWGAVPQANPAAIQGTVPQGNPNMGWGPPAGNTGGRWDNHQRNDGHRDWSSRGGGDSGHSSGRSSWNRQSSFGGGSGRGGSYGPRRSGICRYHLSGHCKKGAGCDHPHS